MNCEQLPLNILKMLGTGATEVFLKAYNDSLQKNGSSSRAWVSAFSALENGGFEKVNGKWALPDDLTIKMHKVQKVDSDKRQIFGFFSVTEIGGVDVVDSQGDIIKADDLEASIYKYVKFSRMGDERHDERCKATLIESMFFSKEKQQVLGIDLGMVGWWGGFEIHDESMWKRVKSGEYQSFSIGGKGRREQIL